MLGKKVSIFWVSLRSERLKGNQFTEQLKSKKESFIIFAVIITLPIISFNNFSVNKKGAESIDAAPRMF